VLTTGRSDLAEGALDVVLEGRAEQVTDDAELEPVATAFAVKYPTGPWDFVVRDGAFSNRDAGGRAKAFAYRRVKNDVRDASDLAWVPVVGSPKARTRQCLPGVGLHATKMIPLASPPGRLDRPRRSTAHFDRRHRLCHRTTVVGQRAGPLINGGDGAVPTAAWIACHGGCMASYTVNPEAVAQAHRLIDARQYVLNSDWGGVQPNAAAQNAYLAKHSWADYAAWHLGLTEGAADETKARYAFIYGDLRRVHRTALIASVYRASEWRHKEIELAAHDLLQQLDAASGL
jgi:hypothetical protein